MASFSPAKVHLLHRAAPWHSSCTGPAVGRFVHICCGGLGGH
ncbi:hypothetical protein [Arthrobacter sp. 260]|nr:hypothetical protein [Arthrobacter sp. 260]